MVIVDREGVGLSKSGSRWVFILGRCERICEDGGRVKVRVGAWERGRVDRVRWGLHTGEV